MREAEFRAFLEEQSLTVDGIATRLRWARRDEAYLGCTLDEAVRDDTSMRDALLRLREVDDPAHAPRQNALRKYYTFVHGKAFPRLS